MAAFAEHERRWPPRPRPRPGLWIILAFATHCAARQYPMPMTAAQLAGYDEGEALAAYLGQLDASVEVCNLDSRAPHFRRIDEMALKALDLGFRDGRLSPERWKGCAELLLRTAPAGTATSLLTDAVRAGRSLLDDDRLETDLGAQARLDAVVRVYLERPAGLAADQVETGNLVALLDRLAREPLGPSRRRQATELSTVIGLERGSWHGMVVDATVLDGLAASGDEGTLRRCADRLPDAALRGEARRRVIRLHVQGSPYPEVRLGSQAVEEVVVRSGANRVSPSRHAPVRGWLDASRIPVRSVLVAQQLQDQTATLLGSSGGAPSFSVLPEVALHGTLQVELAGVSRPVTLCRDPRELDVSPCLAADDVRAMNPLARIDGVGTLRLTDSIGEPQAVALAGRRRLVVPLAVAGRQVGALDWPLAFQAPSDLVLWGADRAGRGPDLDVSVEVAPETERLVYHVTTAGRRYQAVVERAEAGAFHLISRGGRGYAGAAGFPGSDGASGMDGMSASCPSSSGQDGGRGGDGARGGDGGDGGPGGPGGDVHVAVSASEELRGEVFRLLRSTITSEGGPGGPGGAGGRGGSGGRGGRGGMGTVCSNADGTTSSLSGGMDGSSGLDGSSGFDGRPGPPGAPGRVTFVAGP